MDEFTQFTQLDAQGKKVVNVADPTLDMDGANLRSTWAKLGETILTTAATSMEVIFTPKTFLRLMVLETGSSGNITPQGRFNSDSGANYVHTDSPNGGAASTATGQAQFNLSGTLATTQTGYAVLDIINILSIPKIWSGQYYLASTSAATIIELGGLWNNTTAQINTITIYHASETFGVGSRIVVFGRD